MECQPSAEWLVELIRLPTFLSCYRTSLDLITLLQLLTDMSARNDLPPHVPISLRKILLSLLLPPPSRPPVRMRSRSILRPATSMKILRRAKRRWGSSTSRCSNRRRARRPAQRPC